MSEQSVTGGGGVEPATVSSLADDLKALGIRHGDTVMVHTSLRSLGYVIGGAGSLGCIAARGRGGWHSGHADPVVAAVRSGLLE